MHLSLMCRKSYVHFKSGTGATVFSSTGEDPKLTYVSAHHTHTYIIIIIIYNYTVKIFSVEFPSGGLKGGSSEQWWQ